jgi:hypothetical protein
MFINTKVVMYTNAIVQETVAFIRTNQRPVTWNNILHLFPRIPASAVEASIKAGIRAGALKNEVVSGNSLITAPGVTSTVCALAETCRKSAMCGSACY